MRSPHPHIFRIFKREFKKKKAKTETVHLPHKWHLWISGERIHGQTIFSGSSRAVRLEKAANVPPTSNRDFLKARWKPATSLQVQEGKPFKDPRSLPSSSLPWLKPLLVTPAQCPAQHSGTPGTRSPTETAEGSAQTGACVLKDQARPKLKPCFCKGGFFYWVWRMRYDGISLKIKRLAEVTFLPQIRLK